MRATVLVGVVLIAVAAWGCGNSTTATSPSAVTTVGGGGGSGNGPFTIMILGGSDSFRPARTTLTQGASVSWMNSDSDNTIHRIVADDGSFDTGNLDVQAQSAPVAPAVGTVGYHCAIHPEEVGSLAVSR